MASWMTLGRGVVGEGLLMGVLLKSWSLGPSGPGSQGLRASDPALKGCSTVRAVRASSRDHALNAANEAGGRQVGRLEEARLRRPPCTASRSWQSFCSASMACGGRPVGQRGDVAASQRLGQQRPGLGRRGRRVQDDSASSGRPPAARSKAADVGGLDALLLQPGRWPRLRRARPWCGPGSGCGWWAAAGARPRWPARSAHRPAGSSSVLSRALAVTWFMRSAG